MKNIPGARDVSRLEPPVVTLMLLIISMLLVLVAPFAVRLWSFVFDGGAVVGKKIDLIVEHYPSQVTSGFECSTFKRRSDVAEMIIRCAANDGWCHKTPICALEKALMFQSQYGNISVQ
jgi:hypothetical protein